MLFFKETVGVWLRIVSGETMFTVVLLDPNPTLMQVDKNMLKVYDIC